MKFPAIVIGTNVRLAMVAGCVGLVSTGVLGSLGTHSPTNSAPPTSSLLRSVVPLDPTREEVIAVAPDPVFESKTRFIPSVRPVFKKSEPSPPIDVPRLVRRPQVQDPPAPEPPTSAAVPIASKNVQFLANVPIPGALIFGTAGGRFQKRENGQVLFFLTGPTGLTVVDATIARAPVVIGELSIPHWENEDVDLVGNTLLISADGSFGSALFVVDISIPYAPRLRGLYKFQDEPGKWKGSGKPGHIANCIVECRYAYVTGARSGLVAIVDLGDPAQMYTQPALVATFHPPAGDPNALFKSGVVHDVNVDSTGLVWLTGSGGVSAYGVGGLWPGTPTAPVQVASNNTIALNDYILHNSLRPKGGSTLLVTEEVIDFSFDNDGDCAAEGRFETYSFTGGVIAPLDSWRVPEKTGLHTNGSSPLPLVCSAHWFDYRDDGIVSIGWYQQGLRLLDVSNPADIRQVGWFNAPGAIASSGYFHPVTTAVVYVADYQRGLDVIEVCPGTCPLGGGIGTPVISQATVNFKPSEAWGYACPLIS
ncbi:MAG: hypothetical protein ABIS18_04980, partial [Actinomycetota bacterium]